MVLTTSVYGQTTSFEKHGNVGFKSCNAWCADPAIAPGVGACLSATRNSDHQSVVCNAVLRQPMHHTNGEGGHGPAVFEKLVCTCVAQSPFTKHGDNGTVSCDAFCFGSQWAGGTGACSSATRMDNNQNIACSTVPGLLPAAKELTCSCVAPLPPPSHPPPAPVYYVPTMSIISLNHQSGNSCPQTGSMAPGRNFDPLTVALVADKSDAENVNTGEVVPIWTGVPGRTIQFSTVASGGASGGRSASCYFLNARVTDPCANPNTGRATTITVVSGADGQASVPGVWFENAEPAGSGLPTIAKCQVTATVTDIQPNETPCGDCSSATFNLTLNPVP